MTTTAINNCHYEQQPSPQHHATQWRARSGVEAHNNDNRENEIVTRDAQRQQPPHFPSITLPSLPLREPFFHSLLLRTTLLVLSSDQERASTSTTNEMRLIFGS
ncbi:hypothetical protein DEO72_LG10g649 [Vigna unguiculata]|uniref:Uncharacterized protein n=1 Tax=Vigna unguiculata TaxID=3917 RepID=A0A4D6N6I8_VIGUN|nr:hypothetical protein DEO72_LG10g649 [Vigna unguiculata]